MTTTRAREIALAIVLGLGTFMLLMGACLGVVMLNARLAPDHAWFPLPVLAICLGFAVFAERRWRIGLAHPPGVNWRRVYLLAFTATVVGVCVAVLQGALAGLTREAEFGPAGTGAQFRFAFAFVMPLVAAILAEVAFRGVMQGRLQAVMSPLAAIVVVTAINTAAHRWTPETAAQWMGYAALLAGCGYVRWLGGSVLPALTAHFWQNLALAWVLYRYGPFALGALPGNALAATALIGAVALAATIALGLRTPAAVLTRREPPQVDSAGPPPAPSRPPA
jgi:membrane protease YdiL (CAAX protease family)